ncbi:hypothetical protein WR25_23849, partial [Diploscapter pachys]
MSSSMEQTQMKVKMAVDEMMDEIDKKYLREMQRSMFACSAKCCEDKKTTRDAVESCVERCNNPMKSAQIVLEREMTQLQDQLSRCAMTCYDKLLQQHGPDVNKYSESTICPIECRCKMPRSFKFMHLTAAAWLILLSTTAVSAKQITEMPGRICALGDFNSDRYTDILVQNEGSLTVMLQKTKLLDSLPTVGDNKTMFDYSTTFAVTDDPSQTVECSLGDFNGDLNLDILTSVKKVYPDGSVKYVHSAWINNGVSFRREPLEILGSQAMAIDVDGDGRHDVLGFFDDGTLYCQKATNDGKFLITDNCKGDFKRMPNNVRIYPGMPHLYVDVTNDLESEIIFMTKGNDNGLEMQVWQKMKTGWYQLPDYIPPMPYSEYPYVGAPMAADFNADGMIEIMVPVCKKADCSRVAFLARWQSTTDEFRNNDARNFTRVNIVSENTSQIEEYEIVHDPDNLVIFRAGDFSLDGYPDFIALMLPPDVSKDKDKYGSIAAIPTVLLNKLVEEKNPSKGRNFVMQSVRPVESKGLILGITDMATFFDLEEDGSLDILVEFHNHNRSGQYFGFILCPDKGDTTFLKVQFYTNACEDRCDPKGPGISWGGACARFSMSDGWGGSLKGAACQVPSNTHRSLISPFLLYGLGRSPNFVDDLYLGAPRYAENNRSRTHVLKQIVPNSRLIVIPP